MDMNRMTIKLQEALQTASAHAMRRGHQGMDVEHLLLAVLDQEAGIAQALFEQAGVSLPAEFTKYSVVPTKTLAVDPATLAANRQKWQDEWTQTVLR